MARILISHFSPFEDGGRYVSGCFFSGLSKSFAECGHEVKHLVSTRFLNSAWNGNNSLRFDIDKARFKKDIEEFSPDLCIFANNSVPDVVYEITHCPVILLLSDTVTFFNDKDRIKNRKYGDRLFFYAPFSRDVREIQDYFGNDSGKIINILPATAVQAEELPIKHNISFIGSNFQNDERLARVLLNFPDRQRISDIVRQISFDPSSISLLTAKEKELIGSNFPLDYFSFMFSPRDRILTLALLAEHGLALFGSHNWHETAQYFPDVAASYDPRLIYSLEHNQEIYNSSKLCLSVCHTQAEDGFPWRVMDIMASNGCLLSDRKQGLVDFMKGYVELPVYESPIEAKLLAQKLLKDDAWRKDLVEGSKQCISEKGRWCHRFKDIQQIVGVSIITPNPPIGSVSYIQAEDYVNRYISSLHLQPSYSDKITKILVRASKLIKKCLYKN